MLAEIVVVCTTFLLITLGIMGVTLRRWQKHPLKKVAPEPEKAASFVTRDKFTEWKSGIESRMKAVETQWDDTYKKMRRKEARYMAENRHDEKEEPGAAVSGTMEPPMTGEDLERAQNRLRMGIP